MKPHQAIGFVCAAVLAVAAIRDAIRGDATKADWGGFALSLIMGLSLYSALVSL